MPCLATAAVATPVKGVGGGYPKTQMLAWTSILAWTPILAWIPMLAWTPILAWLFESIWGVLC